MIARRRDPKLRLVHHHPGRLRVRSRAFERDGERATRARDALGGHQAVHDVVHDAKTGSLLVTYAPGEVDPDALIETIADATGLALATERERRQGAADDFVIELALDLNHEIEKMTDGRFDLRLLLPGVMAAIGAYSFVRSSRPRLPRWDNLFYWGLMLFVRFHDEEIEMHRDHKAPEQAP